MQLKPEAYSIRIKEIEAGKGELRATMALAMDPNGGIPPFPGERTIEPTFGLPALWIEQSRRDEAMARRSVLEEEPG